MRFPSDRRAARGTTLVESIIAMAVLLVGLLGFMSFQSIVAKANHFATRMRMASALAQDLTENINRWALTDPRLATAVNVTALNDTQIIDRWDMGPDAVVAAPYNTAQYSDRAGDANAAVPNALVLGGSTYQGLASDVDADNDGTVDYTFTRYWNVFRVQLPGSPNPNGLLVQVIVRWREPEGRFRQVTASAFKSTVLQ